MTDGISSELLKKVRNLEIKTRKIVSGTMSGEYHSRFKGRGMHFAEVREYFPGDDVRLIDWNVTAKAQSPHVKQFDEERDLTVIIMIDISASGQFGSGEKTKDEIAGEIAAILGFSAIKNNDKVGLILFTDQIEQYIPPKKGKKHMFRILRDIFYFEPQSKGTNIAHALRYLQRVQHQKAIVFLISDFMDHSIKDTLKIASKRHEIVPIILEDPKELSLPKSGLIVAEDSETGESVIINTYSPDVRGKFRNMVLARQMERERNFKSLSLPTITINIDKNYIKPLFYYFKREHGRHG
ncbi:MAG: DUF58 domain-containing protein [bacterium]|nr:DUF58 domain-containing protein [bacterium]